MMRGATTVARLPLGTLLVANAVSEFGNMLTLVALPWFVLQTTGSATKTGLTGFTVALPSFVVGILGGTLVDRLGYRRTSIIADVVSGLGIALIPLLYHSVGLAFWQLLGLVFLGSLLAVPGVTARRSMLPELARPAGLRLEQVNAGFEGTQAVALLVGPPVAGLLITAVGAGNVLWIDAATFALSALAVGLVVPGSAAGVPAAATGRYLAEVVAGLRFLWRDRVLRALAIGLALANFLGNPALLVLLPVYVRTVFGRPSSLGWMIGAVGAGSVAGALL